MPHKINPPSQQQRQLEALKALDELVPWKEQDHPELKQGAAKWVRKLRQESERRFQKVTARNF
jgi:hypothetical protein